MINDLFLFVGFLRMITIWVIGIAILITWGIIIVYYFFDRFKQQNSVQILLQLQREWNQENMIKKRILVSQEIKKRLEDKNFQLSEEIKEQFNYILDFFEKFSYIILRGDVEIELVSQLYSNHPKFYWEILIRTGYLQEQRKKEENKNNYESFEKLFKTFYRKKSFLISNEALMNFCNKETNLL